MVRTYCETTPALLDLLRAREFDVTRFHEVSTDVDLISLLEAGLGVALVPRSTQKPGKPAAHRRHGHRPQAHRSSLRRRRTPAHGGGLGDDEDAARL